MNAGKSFIFWLIAGSVILLDQASKYLAGQYLAGKPRIIILDNFLALIYVRNKGAAFGLLADLPARFRIPLFLGVTALTFFILWRFFGRIPAHARLLTGAIALVFAGAVGNLIDRVRQGEVVDFIDLHWFSYHWPAFNLADAGISLGAVLLVIYFLKKGPPQARP
ncbi:MAG: signal peptidase II [Thermodesulfobacteriota bacterium]